MDPSLLTDMASLEDFALMILFLEVFLIEQQASQFAWASFSSFIRSQSSKIIELQVLPSVNSLFGWKDLYLLKFWNGVKVSNSF